MERKILVETSARHIHVTKEALETLFGKGKTLTFKKALSQPGQFACEEKVEIVGPKNSIKNVSILGPERSAVQVELSLTDARSIGVVAPIRESGNTENSGSCKIVGPCGEIEVDNCVIAAKRHIHVTPAEAEALNVSDKQIVKVEVCGDRKLIFDDVVVRVHPNFSAAMHIDTDESNAAGASAGLYGTIID